MSRSTRLCRLAAEPDPTAVRESPHGWDAASPYGRREVVSRQIHGGDFAQNRIFGSPGKRVISIGWTVKLSIARQARKRMRAKGGGYRRDHLRALAQRVEVDAKEVRIMCGKSELLRTLVAASGAKTAGFGVPSLAPKWLPGPDSNQRPTG